MACALAALVTGGAAHNAVAQPAEAKLAVRLYDYANVPGDILQTAKNEARLVYRGIGVETKWIRNNEPDPWPRTLTVIILDVPAQSARKPLARALGQAALSPNQRGSIAYVFYTRITNVSWRRANDLGRILGLVIGHEIGHLLLPDNGHSITGLMRASLDEDPFGLPLENRSFNPDQAAVIRGELTSPVRSEAQKVPAGGGDFTATVGADQVMAPEAGESRLEQ